MSANTRPGPNGRAGADVPALLASLAAEVARLREQIGGRRPPLPRQLVTLDQCAVMVGLRKRSLGRYKKEMPGPVRPGGRGRPALWDWAEVHPWLTKKFLLGLPEIHPCYAG